MTIDRTMTDCDSRANFSRRYGVVFQRRRRKLIRIVAHLILVARQEATLRIISASLRIVSEKWGYQIENQPKGHHLVTSVTCASRKVITSKTVRRCVYVRIRVCSYVRISQSKTIQDVIFVTIKTYQRNFIGYAQIYNVLGQIRVTTPS